MRSYIAAFAAALVVSAVLVPLVRWAALKLGAVAAGGGRHIHATPIPRLGGIAIAIGFCAPLVALFFVDSAVARDVRASSSLAVGLVLGGALLCLVGVVDDTRGVSVSRKLIFQVIAALIAYFCGFRIDAVDIPLVGTLQMGIFGLPITLLWIIGITNALNLIDGLDGLAAGVAFFAGFTNLLIAILSGSPFVALLMASFLGALVGFLFYNFNPARIFMGDSGSYFLGFVLATTSLAGASQKASTAVSLLVPMIALGLPIFDTLFSMVRRIAERRSMFSPDRGHIHHRLLDMGITHRRAVLILYAACIVLAGAAIGVSLGRAWQIGVALLVASLALIALVRFVGYFEYRHGARRAQGRVLDIQTQRLRRALPELICAMQAVAKEKDVLLLVSKLAQEMEWVAIRLLPAIDEPDLHIWSTPADDTAGSMSAVRFGLGPDAAGRYVIEFEWLSESAGVSSECHILLQLIADVVTAGLVKVKSSYAPMLVGDAECTATADAPAPHLVGASGSRFM